MLSKCSEASELETGGILLGRIDEPRRIATITKVCGPPADSRRTRSRFWRGIAGLQALIDRAWKDKEYYLGEWHYHPSGPSLPSSTDIDQMKRISESEKYNCPEPILVVVGSSHTLSGSVTAHVFPRGHNAVRLQ